MKIILGADHRGFALKEQIKQYLSARDQSIGTIIDVGASSYDAGDDYINYANQAISSYEEGDRLILFCGSGHGMDIAANRHTNIRAILAFNFDVVKQGREHENANCLIIPSDWTSLDQATQHVELFLNTSFSEAERHIRRLAKLNKLDIGN